MSRGIIINLARPMQFVSLCVITQDTLQASALDISEWEDWDHNKAIQRIKTSIMCHERDEPSVIIRSIATLSHLSAIYLVLEQRHKVKSPPPRAKWIKVKLTSGFIKDDILNMHMMFI